MEEEESVYQEGVTVAGRVLESCIQMIQGIEAGKKISTGGVWSDLSVS